MRKLDDDDGDAFRILVESMGRVVIVMSMEWLKRYRHSLLD